MMIEPKLRFKADDGSDFPDWEEKTLGEICEQLKASIDPRNNPTKQFIEYSMPAYDNHMTAQAVLGQSMNSARKILSAPCVLINKLNVRKRRIWVVEHPEDNAVCSSEFVPLTSAEFDLTFLGYLAMTDSFTGYLLDCSSGSSNSQKRVTPDTILQYLVSLPSLPEQRKIADLLSAVDDVISAQEAEVAAWEKRKKGVMQKLFSQEVRFKADDGSDFPDWEERTFADVFIKLRNNTLSRDCLNAESGQARNIHYGDVLVKYGFIVDIQNNQVPFVNSDVECKRWDRLKDGDIVIADTAEDDSVGKAVEVTNIGSEVVYSGLHTIACRPRESFARNYLGYYMNSDAYHDQLRPYMQGIKVTSVSKGNIALTRMSVPSLPEQREIADCLASLDDVIAKAKGELDAWRELKKGLLQQMFV